MPSVGFSEHDGTDGCADFLESCARRLRHPVSSQHLDLRRRSLQPSCLGNTPLNVASMRKEALGEPLRLQCRILPSRSSKAACDRWSRSSRDRLSLVGVGYWGRGLVTGSDNESQCRCAAESSKSVHVFLPHVARGSESVDDGGTRAAILVGKHMSARRAEQEMNFGSVDA
jgi:hypothetical protein